MVDSQSPAETEIPPQDDVFIDSEKSITNGSFKPSDSYDHHIQGVKWTRLTNKSEKWFIFTTKSNKNNVKMIIDTLITNWSSPQNDPFNRSGRSTKQNINHNLIMYTATLQNNFKLPDKTKKPSSY